MNTFNNAQEAFESYYNIINSIGQEKSGTKFLRNVGFYIVNPKDRDIKTDFRNFKNSYAEYEWDWYLSGNRSVSEIKKKAKIWDKMHGGDNIVNSNYGWQWNRGNQLNYVIDELKRDKDSRRAVLSIYDGKENKDYKYDTPCTMSISFVIENDRLCMSVYMRSNDLWFGFCNDQYCFSKLQELVAGKLNIDMGWYYHFATDLHLYSQHLNKR
jgi:thymidylate synthase